MKRGRDREFEAGRQLVDRSYAEFLVPRCRWCQRRFRQTAPSQNYCGGACALQADREEEDP
jgi:hypothetical protein